MGKKSKNNTVQFGLLLWEDFVCYLDYLNKILRQFQGVLSPSIAASFPLKQQKRIIRCNLNPSMELSL